MKYTLRKWLPILGVCFGTIGGFAASHSDSSSYDSSMMNQNQMNQKDSKVYKEITPPAGPNVDNGVGFSIFAEYILWEARAGGTTAATSGIAQTPSTSLAKGQTYLPGFKYQSGFKVGASAELGHDDWDLEAQYIWYHANDKTTKFPTVSASESTLTPTYMSTPTGYALTSGDTRWNLRYNVVQLNLGRNFLISENLSLRPYYGIQGAWHNQRQTTNYGFTNTTSTSIETSRNVWTKQNWWGVGFQTGMDTGWWFDENWGIYANFGTSLLWGRWNITNRIKNTTQTTSQPLSENWAGRQYGVQPTIDLEMGFRWQMSFDDNTYAFLLQAGWEQQIWINHELLSLLSYGTENLSVQGFNFRARFFF